MFSELCGEIRVCQDCMIAHANGEVSPDRPADRPDVWSAIPFGYDVAMGGEHNDECPNRDAVSSQEECDCGDLGFSWSSCDGCGDSNGGDRYKFTLFRMTWKEAAHQVTTLINRARLARQTGDLVSARQLLAEAGDWRRYLVSQVGERKAQERWLRRVRNG